MWAFDTKRVVGELYTLPGALLSKRIRIPIPDVLKYPTVAFRRPARDRSSSEIRTTFYVVVLFLLFSIGVVGDSTHQISYM